MPAHGGAVRLVQVVRDLDEAVDRHRRHRRPAPDARRRLPVASPATAPTTKPGGPAHDGDDTSDRRTGAGRRAPQARSDGLIVTWRNLKRIPRIPELAIFAIIQSIMFVLLFAFVFGGAIALPGYPDPNAYREYLMPGIFVQTIVFAAATTADRACADDMDKGIIDRFRSLPMARSAVLTGRDARRRRLQRRASSSS